MTKTYWMIIACNEGGWWNLGRFIYTETCFKSAIRDAAKYQAGDFKMAGPGTVTVVEWRVER